MENKYQQSEIFDLVVYTINKIKKVFPETKDINLSKKMIQIIIYFALPDNKQRKYYVPYNYGPYSDLVQRCIGDLYYNGLIDNDKINPNYIVYKNKQIKKRVNKYLQDNLSNYNELSKRIDVLLNYIKYNIEISNIVEMIMDAGKIDIINKRMIESNLEFFPSKFEIAENSINFGWKNIILSIDDEDFEKIIIIIEKINALFS